MGRGTLYQAAVIPRIPFRSQGFPSLIHQMAYLCRPGKTFLTTDGAHSSDVKDSETRPFLIPSGGPFGRAIP
jgi:hypothetical protein